MLLVWVTLLFVVSISVSQVAAQAPGAPNCALFTTMSEEHGKKAQAIEQEAAEQAKTLTGDAAKTSADLAARAAKSEWEMAALSREAARKCLQDYLSGSQAAAPAAPAPVQQAAPVVIQQPAPVVVRQPAPVVRQAAPVVIEQPVPVIVEQVVPVQPFHSTAVSAMAFGGTGLNALNNRDSARQINEAPGTVTTRSTLPSGSTSTVVRRPDGTETEIIRRPGEGRPSFIQTTKKNPDGSATAIQRNHAKETSAITSSTSTSTTGPGGALNIKTRATTRNPDGTVSQGTSTFNQVRKGGAIHIQGTGIGRDGTQTEFKARQFQNFTIESITKTNPDGTVTKNVTRTNTKTGAVTVLPNTPSSNPPPKNPNPIVKAVGKKSSTPIKPVGQR